MNNENINIKGSWSYDYENDLLIFKIKDKDYFYSLDFDDINLVVDLDNKKFISGIRIFDASKVFEISKDHLNNIKNFKLIFRLENRNINIKVSFDVFLNNKKLSYSKDFIKEMYNLEDNSQCNIISA